ncbi:MAG: autotransporter domain-containing protein [Nitrosomonadales bacterium]|nr:autotransporter domain-containing protein [Nitrosomonadales bacterium]
MGGINNTGSIIGGDAGVFGSLRNINNSGIYLSGNSTIAASVYNGGTISGHFSGIYLSGTSTITGGINNNGLISGNSGGVRLSSHSTIAGGVTNSGTISADYNGIYLGTHSTITGGINNSGMISVQGGTLSGIIPGQGGIISGIGGIVGEAMVLDSAGIGLVSGSLITGGLTNSGTISARIGVNLISGAVTDGITNSGLISGAVGIDLVGSSVANGITNSGTISVIPDSRGPLLLWDNATAISVAQGSAVIGDIVNNGIINANASASSYTFRFAHIYGVAVNGSTVTGDIINNGVISAHGIANLPGVLDANLNRIAGGLTESIVGGIYADGIYIGDSIISGSISNGRAGTISADMVGIGIGTHSTVVGGITNSGTISGGTNSLYLDNANAAFAVENTGTLSGAVYLGINTLDLNGDHGRVIGNTTATAVNVNGTFTSEGLFNVEYFNIADGGNFNMAHDVSVSGISPLENAGILSVAASDSVNLNGDYDQTATGVYSVGIGSLGNNDHGYLQINGIAMLANNTGNVDGHNLYVNVAPHTALVTGAVDNVLYATNGITLGSGGLVVADSSSIWNFTATTSNSGHQIDLTASFDPALGIPSNPAGGGSYIAAIGALLNGDHSTYSPSMQALVDWINQQGNNIPTPSQVREKLTELDSRLAGNANAVGLAGAGGGASALLHDYLLGLSSGDGVAKDRAFWVKPFAGYATQSTSNAIVGWKTNSYGAALGMDSKVSDTWRIGGALSYAKSKVDGDSAVTMDKQDAHTTQFSLYGTGKLNAETDLNLVLGLGKNSNTTNRWSTAGGTPAGTGEWKSSSYTSTHTYLSADIGHAYKLSDVTTLTAAGRWEYTHVSNDAHAETGATLVDSLSFGSGGATSNIFSIGMRVAHSLDTGVKLLGHLDVGHDTQGSSSVTATFVGGGPTYTSQGITPASTVLRGGISVQALRSSGTEITASYDVDTRTNYSNQSASVKFRFPF